VSSETRTRGRQPRPAPVPRERKRLEKLYVTEGLTVSEVARELGTTTRRAQAMLVRAGIPLRRRGPRPLASPAESQRQRLERLYVTEGLSVSDVARRLGTTRDRAHGLLVRAGIPLRRNGSKEQLPPASELARLYLEEGLSTRALADRFGVHQRVAWKALKEARVPARRRGSWCKPKWPEWISRDQLADLYVDRRLAIKEVARRLGVGQQCVSKALRAYGIDVDRTQSYRRRPSPEQLVELFVHQGVSTAELATRFGVHRRTPWHWLADAGIETPRRGRPRGASPRAQASARSPRQQAAARSRRPQPLPAVVADRPDGELLTPSEVAAVFGVDPKTISRWARKGRIAAHRTPGGHRRFTVAEVRRCAAHLASDDPARDQATTGAVGRTFTVL
jgi:excisionase family DNA binding protein